MQGPAMEPGIDRYTGNPNSAFEALCHGYIAACAGILGRNTGEISRKFFSEVMPERRRKQAEGWWDVHLPLL